MIFLHQAVKRPAVNSESLGRAGFDPLKCGQNQTRELLFDPPFGKLRMTFEHAVARRPRQKFGPTRPYSPWPVQGKFELWFLIPSRPKPSGLP